MSTKTTIVVFVRVYLKEIHVKYSKRQKEQGHYFPYPLCLNYTHMNKYVPKFKMCLDARKPVYRVWP